MTVYFLADGNHFLRASTMRFGDTSVTGVFEQVVPRRGCRSKNNDLNLETRCGNGLPNCLYGQISQRAGFQLSKTISVTQDLCGRSSMCQVFVKSIRSAALDLVAGIIKIGDLAIGRYRPTLQGLLAQFLSLAINAGH